jgi:hypothetical protein
LRADDAVNAVNAVNAKALRVRAEIAENRVSDLEEALHQAIWCIEFMHGCLTEEQYAYAYPEQTLQHLTSLRELAPPPTLCVHSVSDPTCPSCQSRVRRWRERAARKLDKPL